MEFVKNNAEFVLNNMKQLVRYKVTFFSGAEPELQQLETDIASLKACLKDAYKKHNKDEIFRNYERRIREVVYDVEDELDTCIMELSGEKAKNVLRRGFKNISMASLVTSLRETKVKPLSDEVLGYFSSLNECSDGSAAETKDIRQRKRQNHIVGFEDEATTLINNLTQASTKLEVISIIGMPGLGKTTIAWKIFKDKRIEYEFHTRIWVNISEDFNMKNVLVLILKHFSEPNPNMDVEELVEAVRGHLEKGKFLVVMDDVWTPEAWDEVKALLPMDNRTGRVLITSRQKNVAYHANPMRKPHKLRFLNPSESWELLQYEVYGQLDAAEKELVDVGQVIAGLCDGLPLSIIVIGGILVDKRSMAEGNVLGLRTEWENVSKSVETYLVYEDKNKRLEKIISLSYAKLPYELRDSFLYLGVFPEDANIPARRLTLLWIAEGLIQEIPGKSLEEVAIGNLKDLINRNLVMVEKRKPNGDPKLCRLHDTIRQFCKTEAAFDKQNLFQEVRMSNRGVFEPKLDSKEKSYRRLCIHSYVPDFLSRKPKASKARSFLCFSKAPIMLDKGDMPSITDAFRVLRVLDAENIKFPKFPAKLMQLICLRYLTIALANDHLKNLPEVVSNLCSLQTLIVDIPSRTVEIKADIWKMMQLRHFKSKASIILKCDGNGEGGENLQTLSRLSPESCTDNVFKKVRNLITLGVKGDLSTLKEFKSLEKLERLNKLKLVHDVYNAVGAEQPWRQLPEANRFPGTLKILVLAGTYLSWDQMTTLGKLNSVEELKLKDNAFVGNSWDVSRDSFKHLQLLHIERTNLMSWTTSDDAFPELRSLFLKNCDKLMAIPSQVGKVLTVLYLERVSKFATDSAKKIEKERQQASGNRRGLEVVFKLEIAPGDKN